MGRHLMVATQRYFQRADWILSVVKGIALTQEHVIVARFAKGHQIAGVLRVVWVSFHDVKWRSRAGGFENRVAQRSA